MICAYVCVSGVRAFFVCVWKTSAYRNIKCIHIFIYIIQNIYCIRSNQHTLAYLSSHNAYKNTFDIFQFTHAHAHAHVVRDL